jgi:hypothetical protein
MYPRVFMRAASFIQEEIMLPIPKDDTRRIVQDYQFLCNAVDGKVFRFPVVSAGAEREPTQDLSLYLEKVDKRKLVAFEYETGYVGYWGLHKQIIAANLSTAEIQNVVKAMEDYGPYSDEDVQGLKEVLEVALPHRKDLMTWLRTGSTRPDDESAAVRTNASPAPV